MEYTTKKDINVNTKPQIHVPTEIISDGQLLERNLSELGLSREWLEDKLKRANLNINEVFYAEVKTDGSLYMVHYI
ncbi:YetF domain-containing protein [Desulfolucanica intricata]|uniref:YetF domain-containing protein n=1 Tax=Desulfolucanica intricata TaxID=1285191 RepID=UPI00082CECE9